MTKNLGSTELTDHLPPGSVRTASAREAVVPEEITTLPPGSAPWFTVLVPTRDEAANVEPLLARLASSMGDAVADRAG